MRVCGVLKGVEEGPVEDAGAGEEDDRVKEVGREKVEASGSEGMEVEEVGGVGVGEDGGVDDGPFFLVCA